MPYRNKDEYNDYMREYREKKKLSKAAEKSQIREIPTASYDLPRIDAGSYPPHPKDMDRKKDNLLPVGKDAIFRSVERREKVERLRTRLMNSTKAVSESPFWSSARREFNQKCDNVLISLDRLLPGEEEEHIEQLKKEVNDYDFMLQVPAWKLDRLVGRHEKDIILTALIDIKKDSPEIFSHTCANRSARSIFDEILMRELLSRPWNARLGSQFYSIF
jgi:hypothetical protein